MIPGHFIGVPGMFGVLKEFQRVSGALQRFSRNFRGVTKKLRDVPMGLRGVPRWFGVYK